MHISDRERLAANELTTLFLKNKDNLPYANIGICNEYLGWVNDFHLKDSRNNKIHLNLKSKNDLFLLFVLAVVWSRTGQWENAAFFVTYLKIFKKDSIQFWAEESNYKEEQYLRQKTSEIITKELTGLIPRKKLGFRKDIFASIHLLSTNWDKIIQKLAESEKEKDFKLFMKYLRNIEGLGVGNRKILIKIPLILRELRCQNIYSNISGEYCCVPDARVYKAGRKLNIQLPIASNLEKLIERILSNRDILCK